MATKPGSFSTDQGPPGGNRAAGEGADPRPPDAKLSDLNALQASRRDTLADADRSGSSMTNRRNHPPPPPAPSSQSESRKSTDERRRRAGGMRPANTEGMRKDSSLKTTARDGSESRLRPVSKHVTVNNFVVNNISIGG